MSSHRRSRFLLTSCLRLSILLLTVMLEEWESGEPVAWQCPVCLRSWPGIYTGDIDQHPWCDRNEAGKAHRRMVMTATPRE
jgi:hypothetical protein